MPTVNKEINNLLKLLKQRIHITEKIGEIKKSNSAGILDTQRESEIFSNLLETGGNLEISDDFIISLWRQIIEYSYKVQNDCE